MQQSVPDEKWPPKAYTLNQVDLCGQLVYHCLDTGMHGGVQGQAALPMSKRFEHMSICFIRTYSCSVPLSF